MKNITPTRAIYLFLLFLLNTMMSCSDRNSNPAPVVGQSSDVKNDEKENKDSNKTSENREQQNDKNGPRKNPTKRLSPEMKTNNPKNDQPAPNQSDEDFKQTDFYKEASSTVLEKESLPGMGVLHFEDKNVSDQIHRCNLFLVSSDLVMTNAHCVFNLNEGSSCNRKFLFNIKMKEGSELRGCKKIIEVSDYDPQKSQIPDYAIIQLDSPVKMEKTSSFKIARNGILPTQSFTIHSFDVDSISQKYILGKYKKSSCSLLMHSFLANYHDEKLPLEANNPESNVKGGRSLVVNFANLNEKDNCHLIQGNSGSPVLNSKGEVVGILSGNSINEDIELTKRQMERDHQLELNNADSIPIYDRLKIYESFRPRYFTTNFTCLKFREDKLNTTYQSKWCDNFTKVKKNSLGENLATVYEKQPIEYINYTINTLVDFKIATYLNPFMKKSFPGVKFHYGRTNLSKAQEIANTTDLSKLSKQKDYLVVLPICKDKNFSQSEYLMEVPIYQISYDDIFDTFFRYTREPIIEDIKVNYLRSTANLPFCTD